MIYKCFLDEWKGIKKFFSFSTFYHDSWLTVSNQIVKSLSLPYKKFYFFDIVQPIDLLFRKMVDIIEQNMFNRADFLFRS